MKISDEFLSLFTADQARAILEAFCTECGDVRYSFEECCWLVAVE